MDKEDGIICSFDEFMEHLNKHVKDLHAEVTLNDRLYSEEDYPKLKALVVESASVMERNISKLHLIFSSMTVAALISLLKDTETVFINVVESARLFMCCGLSDAAKQEVISGVDTIHSAIENLVDHCKLCYREKRSKLSPSMTGAVWDACKQLGSISDSNKKACMKECMRMVRIVRDVAKECLENMENDEDDDWDGLLDDIQAFAGEETIDENSCDDERSQEVKKEITDVVQSIQHIFESLFRLYSTSLPDLIPISDIPKINRVSAIETTLSDDVNSIGMMIYSPESTDLETVEKTKKDLQSLLQSLSEVIKQCDSLTSFESLIQKQIHDLDSLASHLYRCLFKNKNNRNETQIKSLIK